MGGISAAYSGVTTINFNNPASYSKFYILQQDRTKEVVLGQVILDIGLNYDSRTLTEANNPEKFTAHNLYFSYLQLGIPIKKGWGVAVGLRPFSKVAYDIERRERLADPNTGLPIDSAHTEFLGDGGSYLASVGTGVAIGDFRIGANFGYLFGKKDYSTRRTLINDSVAYNRSNHQTKASFGDVFFNLGVQYQQKINSRTSLTIGAFGNLKHDLNARRDIIRETFSRSPDLGDFRLDSVSESLDEKGEIIYPSNLGVGFQLERTPGDKSAGWLFGADYETNGWDDYRFYGQQDLVKGNWKLRVGGQISPAPVRSRYWSLVKYRGGFSMGDDYIYLNRSLREMAFSFGLGLPVAYLKDPSKQNRMRFTQYSEFNISFEYIKRGNNQNILKEDLFRLSVGFSFGDSWFYKRKYD